MNFSSKIIDFPKDFKKTYEGENYDYTDKKLIQIFHLSSNSYYKLAKCKLIQE